MATLTFLKDASIYTIDVDPLVGTFIVGEFFIDDVDSTKVGEVITFVDDLDGTGTITYILVGSSATQFVATDTFAGDGGGTGTVNSTPSTSGTEDVHVIQVDSPFAVVTIQELVNRIRDFEEAIVNLDHPSVGDASGKQDLGGGVLVGITLQLLDNWRVQFEPRSGPLIESVSVTGGNLVATNDFSDNPIKPSPFTQVSLTSSSSATIAELQIINLQYLIESARPHHSAFQSILYWNPVMGDDLFLGETPETAVATFARAQTLASDGDVIMAIVPPNAEGVTEEKITISKSILLRGPGREFVFRPDIGSGGGNIITISAPNVGISGIRVESLDSSINHAFITTGDFTHIKECWIHGPNINEGISFSGADNCIFENNFIISMGENGIHSTGIMNELGIIGNHIFDSAENGIKLEGIAITNVWIDNNQMHGSGTYGLWCSSACNKVKFGEDNFISDSGIAPVRDDGINTAIEAKFENEQAYLSAVWIDTVVGTSGTLFPKGTPTDASNNWSDAIIIAANLIVVKIRLKGLLTMGVGENVGGYDIFGNEFIQSQIVLNGEDTTASTFHDMEVQGQCSGRAVMRNCHINAVTEFNGHMHDCFFLNTISLAEMDDCVFINCNSGIAGSSTPTMDVGSGRNVIFRGYKGGMNLINKTGTDNISIEYDSGHLIIDSTCTTGTIIVRGNAKVTDNSGAGCTVDLTGLLNREIVHDETNNAKIFI